MSAIPPTAICIALNEKVILKLLSLLMDNMLVDFNQDNPQSDPEGFEIKSLTARLRPSIKDALRRLYPAPALDFDDVHGKIHLHELDLKWEQLDIAMAVTIKERDIKIFGKTFHLFEGNPHLDFSVSLAKLIHRSEVDVHLVPEIRHIPAQQVDGKAIPETEGWAIGFSDAMVEFDVWDLEGIFEDVVVDALREALAEDLAGQSDIADFLIDKADRLAELLDLPDDLVKWIYDRLHLNLDLLSWLSQTLARLMKEKLFYRLPKTLILPAALPADSLTAGLPDLRLLPIELPIRNPALIIDPQEILVMVELGMEKDLPD
jgi:hypothetical protein